MKRLTKTTPAQQGMASIVVMGVLVVLLTLITIGFSVIMNRAVNNALNNQLSAAANYAAQSGLNDGVKYIKSNPTTSITDCNTGVTALGTLADLSGDNSTQISCLLINSTPSELLYDRINPNYSEVVKINPYDPAHPNVKISQLMISWQSSNTTTSNLPAAASLGSFLSATDWSSGGYPPLVRATLYAAKGSDLSKVNYKTFYFYPISGSSSATVSNFAYTSATGTVFGVNCDASKVPVNYPSGSLYQCNVNLTNLVSGAPDYFYIRLTPVYGQANFKIQGIGTAPSKQIEFQKTQASIDVTAKSGSAAKRIQERVTIDSTKTDINDTSGGAFAEDALRSANTVCKRFDVPKDASQGIYLDPATDPKTCPTVSAQGLPDITESNPTQAPPSETLNGTVNPNGSQITQCTFTWSIAAAAAYVGSTASLADSFPSATTTANVPCGSDPGSGNTAQPVSASFLLTAINGANTKGKVIFWQLTATNSSGTSRGLISQFAVSPGAPTPVTSNATSITKIGARLNGTVNPNGYPVNTTTNNYSTPTPAKAISGCFFNFYDATLYSSPPADSNLHHSNCVQRGFGGSNPVKVYTDVTNLITGHEYKFVACASNQGQVVSNGQTLDYGHTACDNPAQWGSFTPLPPPTACLGPVNAGALVKQGTTSKAGTASTLPTAIMYGCDNMNGWNSTNCFFDINAATGPNTGYPASDGHTVPCDQALTVVDAGQPCVITIKTKCYNLSGTYRSAVQNTWYFYDLQIYYKSPDGNLPCVNSKGVRTSCTVATGNYCFRAGAGGNAAVALNKNGVPTNCGYTTSDPCAGGGCGSGGTPYLTSFNTCYSVAPNCMVWQGGNLGICRIWGNDKDHFFDTDYTIGTQPTGSQTRIGDGPPYGDMWLQCKDSGGTLSNKLPLGGVATAPQFTITNIATAIWDQSPQCGPEVGPTYDKSWYCRNAPKDSDGYGTKLETLATGQPGCSDFGHRWTTCSLGWTTSGSTGAVSCGFTFIGSYNGTDSTYGTLNGDGNGPTNNGYPHQEHWIDHGPVTRFKMQLTCSDTKGAAVPNPYKQDIDSWK